MTNGEKFKEVFGISQVDEGELISELPSITPQEPKTGHWIDADGDNAICSCCNRLNHLYGAYCKHCGAKND